MRRVLSKYYPVCPGIRIQNVSKLFLTQNSYETNTKNSLQLLFHSNWSISAFCGQTCASLLSLSSHNFNQGSFYNDWYQSIFVSHFLYFYIYMVANVMLTQFKLIFKNTNNLIIQDYLYRAFFIITRLNAMFSKHRMNIQLSYVVVSKFIFQLYCSNCYI